MKNVTQLTGKVYPDKSFTIGIVPRKKPKSQDRTWIRSLREVVDGKTNGFIDWLTESVSIGGKYCSLEENPVKTQKQYSLREISKHDEEIYREMEKVKDGDYSKFYEAEPPSAAPLFIESQELSRKESKPYGENGITSYGKKVVRNGAILLEQKYGRKKLGFVTCTLPGMDERECFEVIERWSEITRRFYQKVKRQLAKVDKPFIYTGVTEIQEKRFKKYGVAVPHLHFVYVCRDSTRSLPWVYICQLHRAWNEALGECLDSFGVDKRSGVCRKLGSVHAKTVRKTAAGYLGKYLTKGVKIVKAMKDKGYTRFPKQWWTACMQTKKMFKESIIKIPMHVCNALFYNCQAFSESKHILSYAHVSIEVGDVQRTVGLSGILSEKGYGLIEASLE